MAMQDVRTVSPQQFSQSQNRIPASFHADQVYAKTLRAQRFSQHSNDFQADHGRRVGSPSNHKIGHQFLGATDLQRFNQVNNTRLRHALNYTLALLSPVLSWSRSVGRKRVVRTVRGSGRVQRRIHLFRRAVLNTRAERSYVSGEIYCRGPFGFGTASPVTA